MLSFTPRLITWTNDPLPVVNVVPVWKTKLWSLRPPKSNVKAPFSNAEVEKK